MITHFHDQASNPAWIAECLAMETEGERTPIQTDPHPVVMDPYTPVFLRKQVG